MWIGSAEVGSQVFTAPMAGFSDLPFRQTVLSLGNCCPEGEMVSANPGLLGSEESQLRVSFGEGAGLRIVQLLGANPAWMARAARFVEGLGAQVIDINMGCPAKKVCRTECGAALMKNEELALQVIRAVREAARVPVTLKLRTGWDEDHKNALDIAQRAEQLGVSLITVHGRTRMQGYAGRAEYETVRRIKRSLSIPVIANGDIDSVDKALRVMDYTGADGIMVGRGCLGDPWLPARMSAVFCGNADPGQPSPGERLRVILGHMDRHLRFYGEGPGLRTFRKHLLWYLRRTEGAAPLAPPLLALSDPGAVKEKLTEFFEKAAM
ncbi:tRNA dihydrouridine synthase DusB [Mesosutterella sp. AGMB02718]|uniref:tRNA-dihydrouridine synthase n=1 Tax=Mesosutterella faecium TaxID=2925194 RepID=A0ABT7INQ9_9BURK|nr:tRNA dihydrouridine synthase DusB [Mesosutterella sp. AGMB02718]MDL2058956.1 tRNA dihydrouridine synthase DusB [Mesosutterella sp. AGMB02718]